MAQSDGHDPPWLVDELVPCLAAVIDEIVVRFEDAVGEPVMPYKPAPMTLGNMRASGAFKFR